MFAVLYAVRDKIDRVKALEADKARTASAYDAAQQTLRSKQAAGIAPSDDDMERVHKAMSSRVSPRFPFPFTPLPSQGNKKHVTDLCGLVRDRPPPASRS